MNKAASSLTGSVATKSDVVSIVGFTTLRTLVIPEETKA
jgi:hypothetical protein